MQVDVRVDAVDVSGNTWESEGKGTSRALLSCLRCTFFTTVATQAVKL
jgi:hypothetical protein